MENTMSKSRKILFLVVMCLSNIAIMGCGFYAIITTQLYNYYEEWAVNLAISLPGIIGLVACLAAGKIADKVNKKWLFIVGLALFALSGSTFALTESSLLLVIMASLNGGISYGIVSVSAVGIISDTFADENSRSKILGVYNGVMALVGALLTLLYGFVADINWKLTPAPNWFTVVVIIGAIVAIPSCPPVKHAAGAVTEKVKGEKGWAKRIIPIALAFFIVSFAAMSVQTYLDLYVSGNELGTSSFTGILSSTQTLCSFVFCSIFGFLYGKAKTRVTIPAYFLVTLGIFLLYFFPVKAVAVVAMGIMGMGWGTLYTYWFFRATVVVPPEMVGTATGIITTANSLSYFPMPYAMFFFMRILKTENFRDILVIYGAILAGAFVLSLINGLRKHTADEQQASAA